MIAEVLLAGGAAVGGLAATGYAVLRRKGLDLWLPEYIRSRHRRKDYTPGEPLTVLLCVCDHYEPKRGGASPVKARARVQQWVDEYPKLFDRFRDSLGNPPKHTFFYPEDEYEPEYLDMLAGLCRRGYGEVEVHLHHDNDTADGLRQKLTEYTRKLRSEHGLLAQYTETGRTAYAFIHGNWALDNSRPDGRYCGVDNELDVLVDTGCYADFTMPSAPDRTQTRTINSVYWAVGRDGCRKSHDRGIPVGGNRPDRGLLMVQGPLGLSWSDRKFGLFPGIENGNLQKSQPPTEKRVGLWVRSRVQVPNRQDRVIVKLHTHGVWEPNQDVLLGEPMVRLHETLQAMAGRDSSFRYEYSTAREVVNQALGFDRYRLVGGTGTVESQEVSFSAQPATSSEAR